MIPTCVLEVVVRNGKEEIRVVYHGGGSVNLSLDSVSTLEEERGT